MSTLDTRSSVLECANKFPPNGKFTSFKKRGGNFGTTFGVKIPVHLVLDAILSFRHELPEEEPVKPLSRFQAIMLEMSRE